LVLLGAALPAWGKLICPGGRFTVRTTAAGLDGAELVLGSGAATLSGVCRAAPARRFLPGLRRWLFVKARWPRCHGPGLTMRARFDYTATSYCRRLTGTLRVGGRRVPFVAERIVECGNEGPANGRPSCRDAVSV
jgi:hypothetical protein